MSSFKILPHTEIVLSVKNIEAHLPFFQKYMNMDIAFRGDVHLNNYYQTTASIQEVLLIFQNKKYGNIRLIQFDGVHQELIRPSGKIWDTGGIYDFDLRVKNVTATMLEMRNFGWTGNGEPVQFSSGAITVEEGFVRGKEDMVIALVERAKPPLPESAMPQGIQSNVYNSAMIVADYEKNKHFLLDILGFHIYHEDVIHWSQAENIFNLPHNLAKQTELKMLIVQPQKELPFMIEIVSFPKLKGYDFSKKAIPPNLGILSYRFPVKNVDAFYQYLENQSVSIFSPLQKIDLPPYGSGNAFILKSPEGALLEFYEMR